MAEERLLWEDLNEGDVAVSTGRTITETDVVNFAGLSGDFNWFHIDDVAAKESVFGQRVAHGMLVASIATGLQVALDGAQDRDGRLHGAARVAVPRGGLLRRHDPRQADDRREVRAPQERQARAS